jgi:hypothetical protein
MYFLEAFMKTIFLVFFIISFSVFSQEFDYQKLQFDFYGITHGSDKIITYGDAGHILVSTDKGETWTSAKIFEDNIAINKMIYFDNHFYGICNNGVLFKTDFDLNLINIYQNTKSDLYRDFVVDDKIYIVSSDNSIKSFNLDLELKTEIKIDSAAIVQNITKVNEKLYLAALNGKIVVVELANNNAASIIDVSSYGGYISQLIHSNNSLFLNIDSKVFEMNLNSKEISKLLDYSELLQVYNNELFDLRKKSNNKWNVAWIELYKSNNDNFVKLTQDSIDRFVTPDLYILSYEFIDDNVIIAVGIDKTIYVSNDGGIHWQLKSLIRQNSSCGNWLDSEKGFYYNYGQIFKTTNGGTTWLPQKFTDTLIKYFPYNGSLDEAFYMSETGTGFIWTAIKPKLPPLDTAKIYNFIYTEDFGETYKSTWDWGFKSKNYANWLSSQFPIDIIENDNNIILSTVPQSGDFTKNNRTIIYNCDKEHEKSTNTTIDSISIIKIAEYNNILYGLMWERKCPCKDKTPYCFDSTKKWIASSKDYGKTWDFEFYCVIKGNFANYSTFSKSNQMLIQSKDLYVNTGIDSSYNIFGQYIIDINNRTCQLVYQDTLFYPNPNFKCESRIFMIFDSYIYLRTKNDEIKKCSISDINSPKWETVHFADNDNIYLPNYNFDSVLYSNKYKYITRNPTNVEEKIEAANLYPIAIFPNPASDYIFIQPSEGWQPSEGSGVQIFDMLGIDVSPAGGGIKGGGRIDISFLSPGIYFIKIGNKVEKFVKM